MHYGYGAFRPPTLLLHLMLPALHYWRMIFKQMMLLTDRLEI